MRRRCVFQSREGRRIVTEGLLAYDTFENRMEGSFMTEISKEEFKQSVVDNLKMLFRRSVEDADQQQLFQAVAYATKDIVVDQWMASHKEFEKQDK